MSAIGPSGGESAGWLRWSAYDCAYCASIVSLSRVDVIRDRVSEHDQTTSSLRMSDVVSDECPGTSRQPDKHACVHFLLDIMGIHAHLMDSDAIWCNHIIRRASILESTPWAATSSSISRQDLFQSSQICITQLRCLCRRLCTQASRCRKI